jgi:hypothetical protein
MWCVSSTTRACSSSRPRRGCFPALKNVFNPTTYFVCLGRFGGYSCAGAVHFCVSVPVTWPHSELSGRNSRSIDFNGYFARKSFLTYKYLLPPCLDGLYALSRLTVFGLLTILLVFNGVRTQMFMVLYNTEGRPTPTPFRCAGAEPLSIDRVQKTQPPPATPRACVVPLPPPPLCGSSCNAHHVQLQN